MLTPESVSGRLIHDDGESLQTLASDTHVARGVVARGVGLMFRRGIADEYALVFRFAEASSAQLHMVCVPFDIDVIWLVDGRVQLVKQLSAWTGHDSETADTVVELPAGAASEVSVGDQVSLQDQ